MDMNESRAFIWVILLAGMFAALSVLFLVLYIRQYRQNMRENLMEKKLLAYANQLQVVEDAQKQLKVFRHDIRYHLIVLDGLAKENDDTPVQNYIGEIDVTWKVEVPVEVSIQSFDLTAILENLLENAVQNALKAEEKFISIFIRGDASILYIRIENSFGEVDIAEDGGFRTTKKNKEKHGIGLYSIQPVVDKNNGTLKLDCSGSRFAAEVLLYL